MEDIVDPAELLQHIDVLHQTTFAFIETFPDGEQGAFVVADHLSRRWVLKWAPGARNLPWTQGAKNGHRPVAQHWLSSAILSVLPRV